MSPYHTPIMTKNGALKKSTSLRLGRAVVLRGGSGVWVISEQVTT